MAIREDFYSLKLTVSLPSNFEDWFPIWHMFGGKWTTIIPEKYTPLDTIAVGEDIAYNYAVPSLNSGTLADTTYAIAGMAAASPSIVGSAMAISIIADALAGAGSFQTSRRKDRTGFYYQIGDLKHQSYFKISIETTLGIVIGSIEYATNSRFKKLYLSHGKILGIRKEFDNIYYVTLGEFNEKPSLDFTPSGKLKVWSVDKEYSFDLSQSQITDNGELIFNKDTTPDIEKILANDFFVVDKPWILEDYSLLFEYGLQKNNGFYETNNQKYKAFYEFGSMNIKGVWLQLPKEFTNSDGSKETIFLWKLFTDLQKSMFVLPATESDEMFLGEDSDVGTFKDGFTQLKKDIKDGKTTTARVVLFGAGSQLQNFYQPTLIGEFVKVNDYYFEIVGHPRLETIEVKLSSVNGSANFIETAGDNVNVDVFQQKFWFINELYWGGALEWPFGLWQTEKYIKSLTTNDYKEVTTDSREDGKQTITNTINWTNSSGETKNESKNISISSKGILKQDKKTRIVKTKTTNISLSAYDVPSTILDTSEEKTLTSCSFLTERFYKPYKSFKFQDDKILTYGFYNKYKNWYFFNTGNKKTYKILDATFNNAKSWTITKPLVEIKLTLEGDLTSEITVGKTEGYIFLGKPYPTYSGNHGEMSLYLSSDMSLNTQWMVYMYGNYYSGTYILSEPASQFSLIGTSTYGDNVIYGGRNITNAQISTISGGKNAFVNGVSQEIGNSTKDFLFFLDPKNLLLVYRSGSCAWKFNPQRKLVVTTEPSIKEGIQGQKELKTMKQFITQIIYNADKNSSYWFVSPKSKGTPTSSYESYHISKSSHANTSLTRLYELQELPANDIYFPFEYPSSKRIDNSGVEKNAVVVDTYFPSNLINSGECLEKIYGEGVDTENTLTSLIDGGTFSRGALSFDVKSTSYVDPAKVLQDITYLWAYSSCNSKIYLFYNMNPPEFYIEDAGGDPDNLNPSRPSVFVLVSDNGGNDFYSPSVTSENKSQGSCPLMLLYDFDFRGGIINEQETTCCLFGFTYDRGFSPADKDKNGKFLTASVYSKHCFLAMYCFNFNDVFMKDDIFQFSNEDGTIKWVGRSPKLTATQSSKKSYEYGINKNLFGHKLQEVDFELEDYNDYNTEKSNESSQYLISILNQDDAEFEPGQISVTIDATKTITLFMVVKDLIYKDSKNKENKISGIISLKSSNSGLTWVVSTDNNIPIIYNDNDLQTNPYQLLKQRDGLSSLLFLIDSASKQLLVKNIKIQTPVTTTVIAQNILPQKIYAVMKENGTIYVYYIVDSNIAASISNDGGATWKYLDNW